MAIRNPDLFPCFDGGRGGGAVGLKGVCVCLLCYSLSNLAYIHLVMGLLFSLPDLTFRLSY